MKLPLFFQRKLLAGIERAVRELCKYFKVDILKDRQLDCYFLVSYRPQGHGVPPRTLEGSEKSQPKRMKMKLKVGQGLLQLNRLEQGELYENKHLHTHSSAMEKEEEKNTLLINEETLLASESENEANSMQNKEGDGRSDPPKVPEKKKISGAGKRRLRKEKLESGKEDPPMGGEKEPRNSKRGRASDSTPEAKAESRKKQKTFAEVAGCTKIAVTTNNYPSNGLTPAQAEIIQQQLLEAIDALEGEQPHPSFQDCYYVDGILRVSCKDEATVKWLKETTGKITIEALHLQAVEEGKLPGRVVFRCWIPGGSLSFDRIRNRLRNQNANIATQKWHMLSNKTQGEGQLLIFFTDELEAAAIKMRKTLSFGFKQITLKAVNEKQREEAASATAN